MPVITKRPSIPMSTDGVNATIAFRWSDAPTSFTRRVTFLQIYGDTGSGRTSLAFSAPGPIAYLHCNEKVDGVIERAAYKIGPHGDGRDGVFNFGCHLSGGDQVIMQQAGQVISNFKSAMSDAYRWARTIVVDTHTDLWELLRLARFGVPNPRGHIPSMYGPVNAEWDNIFKQYRDQSRTNLVAIGKIKERYRNDKATGTMEQAGQKHFHYLADVIVKMDKKASNEGQQFIARIEKGWFNALLEGSTLEDEAIEFGTLMGMITETDPQEWDRQ